MKQSQSSKLCSNNEFIIYFFFQCVSTLGHSATASVVVCDPCAVQLSTNVVGFDIFHFNCTFNQHRTLCGLCVATVGVRWDV